MNQLCRVCSEPAAGFHFGAFTCEGCKSFFGRTCNNVSSLGECKNSGKCIITRKNRTTCKSCRLNKCLQVGMSKSGSRYGRRSNWFKIHCLMQDPSQCESPSTTDSDGGNPRSPRNISENKPEIKLETELDQDGSAGTSSPSISLPESRVPTEEVNLLEFISTARSKLLQSGDWYRNGLETSQAPDMLRMLSTLSPFLVSSLHGTQFSEISRYYSFLSLLAQSNQTAIESSEKSNSSSPYDTKTPSAPKSSSPDIMSKISLKRKAEDTLETNHKLQKVADVSEQKEPMDLSVKRSKTRDSILSCSMTVTTLNPYESFNSVPSSLQDIPPDSEKSEVDICSG